MSESHLPDDLSRWPHDPRRVLRVGYDAGLREVRQAYARLIRCFRPDEYPDHFQRISDAFRSLERELKDASAATHCSADAPPMPYAPDADGTIDEQWPLGRMAFAPASPTTMASSPQGRKPPSVEEIWRSRRGQGLPELYTELSRHRSASTATTDTCLRLYWLLWLQPELDPTRDRCTWLLEALRGTGMQGPALRLYCNELKMWPREATTERCTTLARQTLTNVASQWFLFLPVRWRAVCRAARCDLLLDDLNQYRAIAAERHHYDGRLLVAALRELIWHGTPEARQAVLEYLRLLEAECGSDLPFHQELAGLDRAMELSRGLDSVAPHFTEDPELVERLRNLLRASCASWEEDTSFHLLSLFQRLVQDSPDRASQYLQRLAACDGTVFVHVHRLLHEFARRERLSGTSSQEPLYQADLESHTLCLRTAYRVFWA